MSRASYERMRERMEQYAPGFVAPSYEESGFVVECTEQEDRARQEFKAESDVVVQLQRYGAGLPFSSGERDDTLDLMRSYELVQKSRDAWARLPERVQEKYSGWRDLERAAADGSLQEFLKAPAPAEVPSAGGGASPSESAADGGTSGTPTG